MQAISLPGCAQDADDVGENGSLSRAGTILQNQQVRRSSRPENATADRRVPLSTSNSKRTGKHVGRGSVWPDYSPKEILHFLNRDPSIAARFWEKVDRRGPDDCWPWTASSDGRGYGHMKVASHETRSAHRIAWALQHDREPAPLLVRHACDNPACCNPAHLLLGTHQDNMDDKTARGRGRTGRQDGAHNGRALLTEEQVGQIVRCFRDGLSNQDIADRFPVGHSLVSRIRTGRSWRKQTAAFGWEPRRLVAPPPCHLDKGEG